MKRIWSKGELSMRDSEIIKYYKLGYSMRECAKCFGVCLETVRRTLKAFAPKLIRPIGDTRNHSSGKAASNRHNHA